MKLKKFTRFRVKYYVDFLWVMTEKELKARYKNAVLGFLWVLLNPIIQMLIIGFIFSFFIKIQNYYLYLLAGLLPWQFFSLSLNKATGSFVSERALLQKAKFPSEVIPISTILSNFIHLLASLLLFLIFLLLIGKLSASGVLLLIPALVWLLAFVIGTSLLTSSLQVRYRDISFFISTFLVLWFYTTPILYDQSLIPETLRPLYALNPLSTIFEMMHMALLNRGAINYQIAISNLTISLLVIVSGIFVFRKENKHFVDKL